MKKTLLIFTVIATLALTSCSFLSEKNREALQLKAKDTLVEAQAKLEAAREQLNKTKDSINAKVTDVKTAASEVSEAMKEVREAIDAIKNVTGGSNEDDELDEAIEEDLDAIETELKNFEQLGDLEEV